MTNNALSKNTVSFGLALAIASVGNGLLVVVKEKNPAVMTAMQKLTWHHWISHSLIILILFATSGSLFAQFNNGRGPKLSTNQLINVIMAGVGIGGFIIVGFYLING